MFLLRIKLIADSTCDLPEELIEKYDIRIVPLSILMGDGVYKDRVEVAPRDIFAYVESGEGMCRTSAVNIAEYMDAYEEERAGCDAIIHFIISAEMSSCYQNARLAAEAFDNIYLVDCRNLSTAIGHLVLDAAEMIAQEVSAADIHREIIGRIPLLDASFIIDTLTYLHKGGRCNTLQTLVSEVFNIKPAIVVSDGKMSVGKKYRGSLENVLRRYVADKLSDPQNIDTRRLFVTHTMTDKNRALIDTIKALAAETLPFTHIYEATAGGTISCHCGPNALGLFFFRKHGII